MGQRERKIKTASPTRTVSNEFYSRVKALLDKKVNVESRERERERDSSSIVSRWQKEKEKKIATRLSSFSSLSTSRYLAVVLSRVRLIDPALPSLQQLGRPRSSSNERRRGARGAALGRLGDDVVVVATSAQCVAASVEAHRVVGLPDAPAQCLDFSRLSRSSQLGSASLRVGHPDNQKADEQTSPAAMMIADHRATPSSTL